jgi:hypothetical protein
MILVFFQSLNISIFCFKSKHIVMRMECNYVTMDWWLYLLHILIQHITSLYSPPDSVRNSFLPSACGTAIHRASIKWWSKGTLRKTVMGRQWRRRTEMWHNKIMPSRDNITLSETTFYVMSHTYNDFELCQVHWNLIQNCSIFLLFISWCYKYLRS